MKLKPIPLQNEKRAVNRVRVGPSRDFRGCITVQGCQFFCEVDDFHFLGVKLSLKNIKDNTLDLSHPTSFELIYGNKVLTSVTSPQVIRYLPGENLILSFRASDESRGLRSKVRMKVKPTFKPVILAQDPIKIEATLNFEVINFNAGGMLLSTSLTNKHLVKDLIIKKAQLLLPGVRLIEIGFKIKHLIKIENRIHLGVELIDITSNDIESLAQFAIFGTLKTSNTQTEKKINTVKENIGKIRKLSSSVRCDVVSTPQEYSAVLQIRYEAYKSVGKILDTITVEDMADDYDNRSVIIAARIDGTVVGTVRLVEAQNGDKFPFEEYIQFEEVLSSYKKNMIYEVGRLAVDPQYQGTDIVTKLFKEVARTTLINKKTTVCLSTRVLRKMYYQIGFRLISHEVPHPTLKTEKLALLKVDSDEFIRGSTMSALAWDRVAKDVVQNLHFAEVTKISPNKARLRLMMQIEKYILMLSKLIKNKKHRNSK